MDVVWTQAVRAENGVGKGMHTAAWLGDMHSFFDAINHEVLQEEALVHDFPRAIFDVQWLSIKRRGAFKPKIVSHLWCIPQLESSLDAE